MVMAISTIGIMLGSIFSINGAPVPSGSIPFIMSTFSRMSRAAKSISVPLANSTITVAFPSPETECMDFIFDTVLRTDSSGLVTSDSTSMGPAPE